MVVTFVVVTFVVVTFVVVTLIVLTLVVAERVSASVEIAQVDLFAGQVDDLSLVQNCRERLAAGDLGHHRGNLSALIHRFGELVRVHAVLLGRHHQVLDELGLANADLLLLGDRVEQEL